MNKLRKDLKEPVRSIINAGKDAEEHLRVVAENVKKAETKLLNQKKALTQVEVAFYNSLNGRNSSATTTTTTAEGNVETKEEANPVNFRQHELNRMKQEVETLQREYLEQKQSYETVSKDLDSRFTPMLTEIKRAFDEYGVWVSVVDSFNVATYSTVSDLMKLFQQVPEKIKKQYEQAQCDLLLCPESEFLLVLKDACVSYLPQPLLSLLTYCAFAEKVPPAVGSAMFELHHAGIMDTATLGKRPLHSDVAVYFIFDHRSAYAPLSICVINFSAPAMEAGTSSNQQKILVDFICVRDVATMSPNHHRAFKKVLSSLRQQNREFEILDKTHAIPSNSQNGMFPNSLHVILFSFTQFHPSSRNVSAVQDGYDSTLLQFSQWLEKSTNTIREQIKEHQRLIPIALRKADPAVVSYLEFSKVVDHIGGSFIGILRKTEDFSRALGSQSDDDLKPRLERETEALIPRTLVGKAALAEMIDSVPDASLIRNVADIIMKKIRDPESHSKILRKRVALKLCDKLQYLMITVAHYVLEKTEIELDFAKALYQRPIDIDRYKKFLKDCLALFQVYSSEGLLVNDHVEPELFEAFQTELNTILDILRVPPNFVEVAELNLCFTSLSSHLLQGVATTVQQPLTALVEGDVPLSYSEERKSQERRIGMEKLTTKLRNILKGLTSNAGVKPRKLIRQVEAAVSKAEQLLKSNRLFTNVEVNALEKEIEEFEVAARNHENEVYMNDEVFHKLKRSVLSFQFPVALTTAINELISVVNALPSSVVDNAGFDAVRASHLVANSAGESASTAISTFSRGAGTSLVRQNSAEYTKNFEELQRKVFGISIIFSKISLARESLLFGSALHNKEPVVTDFLHVDMLLFFADRYQQYADRKIRKFLATRQVDTNEEEIRSYLQDILIAPLDVIEKINHPHFSSFYQKMMLEKRKRQLMQYLRHNVLSNVTIARSFYQYVLPETGEDYWMRVARETGLFWAYRTLRYMCELRDDISNIVKTLPTRIPTRASFIGLAPKDVLLLCNVFEVDVLNGIEFLHTFEESADLLLSERFNPKNEVTTVLPGVIQELQQSECLQFLVKHISATVNPVLLSQDEIEAKKETNSTEKVKIHPNGLLTSIHEWLPLQVLYGGLLIYHSHQRLTTCLIKERTALQGLLLDRGCLLDDSVIKRVIGDLAKLTKELEYSEEKYRQESEEHRKLAEVFDVLTDAQVSRRDELKRTLPHSQMKIEGQILTRHILQKELESARTKRVEIVLDCLYQYACEISSCYRELFQTLSGPKGTSFLCDGSSVDHVGYVYNHLLEEDNSLEYFDSALIDDLSKRIARHFSRIVEFVTDNFNKSIPVGDEKHKQVEASKYL